MFPFDLIVFVLVCASVSPLIPVCEGQALVQFRDCGTGEVTNVTIDPCPTLPCHFDAGDRANLSITFTPKHSACWVQFASTLRRGGLWDYELEVPETDPNVCRGPPKAFADAPEWSKLECPLHRDRPYTFVISRVFPVSSSYNIFRYSKVRFFDQTGATVACVDMRLQFHYIIPFASQMHRLSDTRTESKPSDNHFDDSDRRKQVDRTEPPTEITTTVDGNQTAVM